MPHSVELRELLAMTSAERGRVLQELVVEAAAAPNGHVEVALGKIRAFEDRYEMSSARMIEALQGGRTETADIAEWLFWLRLIPPGDASKQTRT